LWRCTLDVKREEDDARELQLQRDTCGTAKKHRRPKPPAAPEDLTGLCDDDDVDDGGGGGGGGDGGGGGNGGGGGSGVIVEPAAEGEGEEEEEEEEEDADADMYPCGYADCKHVNFYLGFECIRISCGRCKRVFCVVCGGPASRVTRSTESTCGPVTRVTGAAGTLYETTCGMTWMHGRGDTLVLFSPHFVNFIDRLTSEG